MDIINAVKMVDLWWWSWRNRWSTKETGNTPPTDPPQGNPGDLSASGRSREAGATAAGGDATDNRGGDGGAGAPNITGSDVTYAGGGGGMEVQEVDLCL